MDLQSFIDSLVSWATSDARIAALALVGSHARGEARPDSDVDLVLVSFDRQALLDDVTWPTVFGPVERVALEDYGFVQSLRVTYAEGLEVEFGVTGLMWTALPLDPGTKRVVDEGLRILYDPDGRLERTIARVAESRGGQND